MDKIYEIVKLEMGVDKGQLLSKRRFDSLVKARALFVCLAKHYNFSYSAIGRELKKDHSTAIHLYKKFKETEWIKGIMNKNYEKTDEKKVIKIKLSGRYGYLQGKFNGKCVVCGFDEIVEVHHILQRCNGGTDDEENLVLLCPNHHALADKGMLSIKDIHSRTSCPQY